MNIGILEPSDFSVSAIDALKSIGTISFYKGGDILKYITKKQILFVRLNISIDKQFLEAATSLKILCTPTTGLNHINIPFCEQKGIKVISLKGEAKFLKTIRATPEHTLGLIIALKRNYKNAFRNEQQFEWNRDPYRGYEVYKSKIGIIGLGRVGNILSGYLKKMGAEIGYYDIDQKKQKSGLIRYKSIQSLIENSDTVVLCSSYSNENGVIIDKKEIDAMRGKYFVNTARAELTNEKYLVKKANSEFFQGIAIDVILNEQDNQTNLKSWLIAAGKNNVIVTPHIGGATYSSMSRTEEFIVNKLIRFIEQS